MQYVMNNLQANASLTVEPELGRFKPIFFGPWEVSIPANASPSLITGDSTVTSLLATERMYL